MMIPTLIANEVDRYLRTRDILAPVQGLAAGGIVHGEGDKVPNYFFVYSGSGGSNGNDGHDPRAPLATIDAAIGKCTANRGDVIFVLPGHAETLTAAIALDVAGVSIVGLGRGRNRPSLTVGAAIDGIAISAANCYVGNLHFPISTVAGVRIDVAAVDAVIEDCEFMCGADDQNTITIPATADRAVLRNLVFRITANGPDAGIKFEAAGTEGVMIENVRAHSMSVANAWDDALIYSASAHTDCVVKGVWNDFGPTLIFSAAATGIIQDVWPGEISETANGYQFVGGACSVYGGPEEGYRINKATADIFTGAAVDLLTIASGRMLLKKLIMEVTTIIQNQATTFKFQANPTNTGNTTNDLCGTVDMDADKVGSLYTLDGVAGTALLRGETGAVAIGNNIGEGWAINPGAIEGISGADSTGSAKIAMWVKKIDPACIWSWT